MTRVKELGYTLRAIETDILNTAEELINDVNLDNTQVILNELQVLFEDRKEVLSDIKWYSERENKNDTV